MFAGGLVEGIAILIEHLPEVAERRNGSFLKQLHARGVAQERGSRDPIGFADTSCDALEQVLLLALCNRLIIVGLNALSGFGQQANR